MKSLIKSLLALGGLKINRTASSLNHPLWGYNISREEYKVHGRQFLLHVLQVNVDVRNKKQLFLLEHYGLAKNLATVTGAQFAWKDNILQIKIGQLLFCITEREELYILNEVFVEGCYNINPLAPKCILIDIGMNVGITSLYFAQKEEVKAIYSFEPFCETYAMAMRNFNHNEIVAAKIKTYNFGLADADGSLSVEFSTEARGRMGINGLPPDMKKKDKQVAVLQVKNAASTLLPILQQHGEDFVLLKCDCEGAEYGIIQNLASAGLLSSIDMLMLEWHYKQPDIIVQALNKAGMATLATTFEHLNAGLIYGFKRC